MQRSRLGCRLQGELTKSRVSVGEGGLFFVKSNVTNISINMIS